MLSRSLYALVDKIDGGILEQLSCNIEIVFNRFKSAISDVSNTPQAIDHEKKIFKKVICDQLNHAQ